MKIYNFFCCMSVIVLAHTASLLAQQAPPSSGPETVETVEKIGVQGNWVKKRELLLKSNELNTQIQELAGQTESIRKSFIDRYTVIDTALNNYYKTIGLEAGKLQELFDNVMQYLEKKKKKDIASLGIEHNKPIDVELQSKIEVIENSINESKMQLEQLKLDMKSIEDLDHSLSDRIKRVDETIGTITGEAARANDIIEELWSIIDHNKARDRYYELSNNILEKIKALQAYLSTDLTQDFDTVIQTVQAQITRTQEGIKKIEADGLFIKNRAHRVKELKLKNLQQKEADATVNLTTQQEAQKTETAKAAPQAWYMTLYNHIINFFKSLYNGLIIIKNTIMESSTQKKPVAPQAAVPAPLPTASPESTGIPPTSAESSPQTPAPAQDLTASAPAS